MKGPWAVLGAPWSSQGLPEDSWVVPWGFLGSADAPRGCLGCLLGDPWGDLGDPRESLGRPRGVPGELLGRFWVPKSMQKLESIDLKIDETPLVFISYLRLGVGKR